MATGPKRNRRGSGAARWRRLILESMELRLLLSGAPIGLNGNVTTFEDTTFVFGVGDFAFTDPLDVPSNGLRSVKIAKLPEHGSLLDGNLWVLAGQFIPAVDIWNGQVRFIP